MSVKRDELIITTEEADALCRYVVQTLYAAGVRDFSAVLMITCNNETEGTSMSVHTAKPELMVEELVRGASFLMDQVERLKARTDPEPDSPVRSRWRERQHAKQKLDS